MTLSRSCTALLLALCVQASAQSTSDPVVPVTPPVTPTTTPAPPAVTTNPAAPVVPPTPAPAPLTSRFYAGASFAPSFSGGGSAYGIVVGSSQVFGSFGAQAGVDYVTSSGALSVDAALLYRLNLMGRFQPYAGVGLGLTSSPAADQGTPPPGTAPNGTVPTGSVKTATDYAAVLVVGSDYLLTDSIALSAEANYRAALSSKGVANGAGLRGRLGLKFLF